MNPGHFCQIQLSGISLLSDKINFVSLLAETYAPSDRIVYSIAARDENKRIEDKTPHRLIWTLISHRPT